MKYLDVNLLRLRQPPKTNLNERGEERLAIAPETSP
jgi:hypothetical protein